MLKTEKNNLDRMTFSRQLSLVFVTGILVLTLVSTWVVGRISSDIVRSILVEENLRVVETLAGASDLLILHKSAEAAKEVADDALAFPDVKGVSIVTRSGDALFESGQGFEQFDRSQMSDQLALIAENEDLLLFSAPVFASEKTRSELLLSEVQTPDSIVGHVSLLVSKDSLKQVQAEILGSQLPASLGLALVLLILLLAITRRLTTPVERLSKVMDRAAEGEESIRAEVSGPADVARMQTAFNGMMEVLENRQHALQDAMEAALESARVKGEFAANVTHELRTPMNAVLGMLDLLLTMGLTQKQSEYVETAKTAGQGLLHLIDEILDFSEIEAGKLVVHQDDCIVEELLEDVVGLLSGQALRKGVDIAYCLSPDVPSLLKTDASRLRQVLINVVGNAIKFTDRGEVAVRMSLADSSPAGDSQAILQVEISDTGIGMDELAQDRIFDAFTQIDSSSTKAFKGTGLGLAISKQILDKLGGSISVSSELGRGSTFTLQLPVEARSAPVQVTDTILEHHTAVVICQSQIIHDFVQSGLDRAGANSVHFFSGLDALSGIRKNPDVDILILEEDLADIQLEDFLRIIRTENIASSAQIVALCNPWSTDQQAALREGLVTLNKPLRAQSLYQLLNVRHPDGVPQKAPDTEAPYAEGELPQRVLVVDDNRANQQVAVAMLERIGIPADVLENGQLAVEHVVRTQYDLILMDCNMPVMDGFEATRQIRQFEGDQAGKLPIIALTAHSSGKERQKCIDAGMSDFIPKPLSINSLRKVLAEWLGVHPTIPESPVPAVDNPVTYRQLSFDPQALAALREAVGEVLESMIVAFLEDTPEYLQSLKAAIVESNAKRVREVAHTIKGSAMNFGARDLVELSASLEGQAASGDLDQAVELASKMQASFEVLERDLSRELPAKDLSSTEGVPRKSSAKEGQRILIVDDDRTMRVAMAHALVSDDCQVEQASNGSQAIAICSRNMPDLILMDALMPEMNGFEACQQIRELPYGADIPILMITSLNDEESIVQAFAAGATDYVNKPVHFAVLKQRVARLVQSSKTEKHVKRLAYHDQLTGLPNRANLMQQLRVMLNRAKIEDHKVAMLFLDLDRFKMINDTMGHDAGDLLLKAVSERIRHCVRDQDFVARLGGDEFTIVLEGIHDVQPAITVAKNICATLNQPFVFMHKRMFITASVGISLFPDDGSEVGDLIKHADAAMFKAKQSQSDYYLYDPSIEDEIARRWAVGQELKNAVAKDQLRLHYQPKVDLATGEVIGAEALVRWQHPERGLLSPFHFIGTAEETGLIGEVTDWVLDESARQLSLWRSQGHTLTIAANLSGKDLEAGGMFEKLSALMALYDIPKHALELEITESTLMEDPDTIAEELRKIRDLGVTLSIDDFGSGFSSLSYLKKLPVDYLKIDRAFVNDLETDPDDSALINGIVALARSLKLKTIAEGVETETQRAILQQLGCDLYQGYLCSKPVPADEFEALFLACEVVG